MLNKFFIVCNWVKENRDEILSFLHLIRIILGLIYGVSPIDFIITLLTNI